MDPSLRIGLIGPDRTRPCGIADYTARLAEALERKCDLVFASYREALADPRLSGCRGILVQYERSLAPAAVSGVAVGGRNGFLAALARRHPGRVFVVPHEVYDRDPFAFPYADLKSVFPPWLWLKRLRYRWNHRAYADEKRLQAAGYHAHRVIPLSGPGAEILRALAPGKVLDPVPHAVYAPPEGGIASPDRSMLFPIGPRAVVGIFGFLNPGSDYGTVLDALEGLDSRICLLVLGGPREAGSGEERIRQAVADRGLSDRVRITGYIPEENLAAHLRLCDAFVGPMRFKSNSGSLLHLFHLGKPIFATDLPLTRYLRGQGAPLVLYADAGGLKTGLEGALSGIEPPLPNRYPWDFDSVADAYLRILSA